MKDSKINIFVSYSHKNSSWVDKEDSFNLVPFLEDSLDYLGVNIWYDHDLKTLPGIEYEKKINDEIDRADIVILLLSRDFINSKFIMEKELPRIRKKINQNNFEFIPILVEPWTVPDKHPAAWLVQTQIIPGNPTPLINFTDSRISFLKARNTILESLERTVNRVISSKGKQQSDKNDDERIEVQEIEPINQRIIESEKIEVKNREFIVSTNANGSTKSNQIYQQIELDIQAKSVTLNSDGTLLAACVGYGVFPAATVGYSGKIELWDLKRNIQLKSIEQKVESPRSIKFSPDDKYIAIGGWSSDAELAIWDYNNYAEPVVLCKNKNPISNIEFSADGKFLYAAGKYSIHIWDIEKRNVLAEITGHKSYIENIATDNNILASIDSQGQMGLWDLNNFKNIRFRYIPHGQILAFLPNSQYCAIGLNTRDKNINSDIKIYDIKNDKIVDTINGQLGSGISALKYCNSNQLFVSGSRRHHDNIPGASLQFYEIIENMKWVERFEIKTTSSSIWDIAFSKNGRIMATAQGAITCFKKNVGGSSVSIYNGFKDE